VTPEVPGPSEGGGRLAHNVVLFARTLRAAGLPVGPGQVIRALEAIGKIGLSRRDDLYWTLFAVFVNRQEQREIFDQCFHIFWRDPNILERMMQLLLPESLVDRVRGEQARRRVSEAFAPPERPTAGRGGGKPEREPAVELDAFLTWSAQERLRKKDFEEMSVEELEAAKRHIRRMRFLLGTVKTRRFEPDLRGRHIDLRRTLRRSLREGGAIIDLARRSHVHRPPPLVILCDISGSMARYSRMLLLFMHTITTDRERVSSFVFGTRLSNITRHLRHRDPDRALEKIGEVVQDWGGGTRIGHCLERFNVEWSRRVLAQGAVVLLITDGLDREGGVGLEAAMERLHKSCRRLIWLNPLLRYDAYAPISSGARIIIRHVDEVRSVHNLESLEDLARVLEKPAGPRLSAARAWRERLFSEGGRPAA